MLNTQDNMHEKGLLATVYVKGKYTVGDGIHRLIP